MFAKWIHRVECHYCIVGKQVVYTRTDMLWSFVTHGAQDALAEDEPGARQGEKRILDMLQPTTVQNNVENTVLKSKQRHTHRNLHNSTLSNYAQIHDSLDSRDSGSSPARRASSRQSIAMLCARREVKPTFFTSGGTESVYTTLYAAFRYYLDCRRRFLILYREVGAN